MTIGGLTLQSKQYTLSDLGIISLVLTQWSETFDATAANGAGAYTFKDIILDGEVGGSLKSETAP